MITRQLMELRQVQELEGDFGQVYWHLTETQGAKILVKLSYVDFKRSTWLLALEIIFCSHIYIHLIIGLKGKPESIGEPYRWDASDFLKIFDPTSEIIRNR